MLGWIAVGYAALLRSKGANAWLDSRWIRRRLTEKKNDDDDDGAFETMRCDYRYTGTHKLDFVAHT